MKRSSSCWISLCGVLAAVCAVQATYTLYIFATSRGPIIRSHGFSYYADDTQHYLSFPPEDPTVLARIRDCLSDISAWMKARHL